MLVLSIVQGLRAPGGIENSLIKEIPPLKNAGVEMIVVAASGGKMVRELEEVGIKVVLPENDLDDNIPSQRKVWEDFLLQTIAEYQPDILYPHQPDPLISCIEIDTGLPVVSAMHSRILHWMGQEREEKLSAAIPRTASFHAVGHAIGEELRYLGAREITSISSPVFPSRAEAQARVAARDPQIIFVGRPDHRKGLDVLIEALPALKKDLPRMQVKVFGNDGETERLLGGGTDRPLAKSLGVDESIVWMGHQPHEKLMKAMEESDLLVSSSRQEGLTSVILEAHALALPVVATSPSAEAMRWGDAGLLVPRDNPHLLGEAIKVDLGDPGRRQRAQGNCLWVLDNFSIDDVVNNIKNDFERVLAS